MYLRRLAVCCRPNIRIDGWRRNLTTTARLCEKPLPPRRAIPDNEITEAFLKGSGPGGQKINKTSSAVQLKHLPTGIVVKSQATRSRDQNRKFARRLLAEKLEELEKGDKSRTAIKAERARTKKASAEKKSKRKYRKLADENAAAQDEVSEVSSHNRTNLEMESMESVNREPEKLQDAKP